VNVELAVRSHLAQDSGVTTLVSTRIYQVRLPQSPTLPALRVQLISEPHNHHLRGPDGAARARVQIDTYVSDGIADPYGSIDAIGSAIRTALDGATFTVSGVEVTGAMCVDRRVMYEADDLRLWREMQDYIVWTRTA
jgi:hypothetical protein